MTPPFPVFNRSVRAKAPAREAWEELAMDCVAVGIKPIDVRRMVEAHYGIDLNHWRRR